MLTRQEAKVHPRMMYAIQPGLKGTADGFLVGERGLHLLFLLKLSLYSGSVLSDSCQESRSLCFTFEHKQGRGMWRGKMVCTHKLS